jgi:hypothetical protein
MPDPKPHIPPGAAALLHRMIASDPGALWASLSTAEAALLLRAAPKIAAPWLERRRRVVRGRGFAGAVWSAIDGEGNATGKFIAQHAPGARWSTLAEAMTAEDVALRDEGWLLLNEEVRRAC